MLLMLLLLRGRSDESGSCLWIDGGTPICVAEELDTPIQQGMGAGGSLRRSDVLPLASSLVADDKSGLISRCREGWLGAMVTA
jgi:hypothetical protein